MHTHHHHSLLPGFAFLFPLSINHYLTELFVDTFVVFISPPKCKLHKSKDFFVLFTIASPPPRRRNSTESAHKILCWINEIIQIIHFPPILGLYPAMKIIITYKLSIFIPTGYSHSNDNHYTLNFIYLNYKTILSYTF